MELYYPLSPTMAILLTPDPDQVLPKLRKLGALSVEAYNHFIYRIAADQIYANDREYLAALTATPKDLVIPT